MFEFTMKIIKENQMCLKFVKILFIFKLFIMEGNNRYEFEEAYKHSLLNLNLYFIFLRTKHN